MLFPDPEKVINTIYPQWMKEERIKYAKDKCDLCLIQEEMGLDPDGREESQLLFKAYKTGALLCQQFDKGCISHEDTYLIIDREKEIYCVEEY